jgi:hypothetical protein
MRSDFDFYYGYENIMFYRRANRRHFHPPHFDKHYTTDEHWKSYQQVTRGAIPGTFLKRHATVYSARKRGRKKFDYVSYHTYWALMHKTARNRFEVTK